VGTTGWYDEIDRVKQQCGQGGNSLIYASFQCWCKHFFFHVIQGTGKTDEQYPYYEVQVEEIHHTQSLTRQAGTAIIIAEGIIENLDSKKNGECINADGGETADDNIKSDQYNRIISY